MIAVKSKGRMGNQMFQFAFAYSKSRIHNTSPFIDKWASLKYFELHNKYKYVNLVNKAKFTLLIWRDKLGVENFTHGEFKPSTLNIPHLGVLHLGYYQSAAYFKDIRSEIKSLFTVKKKYRSERNSQPYAAIHMRFGDYKKINSIVLGDDVSIGPQYYQKAARNFLLKYEQIIIVSDDIDLAKTYFPKNNKLTFRSKSEIDDFQVLMHADALCISNSTFSWWAAYLNDNAVEIIAPDYWMGINIGEVFPQDIYLGVDWTRLSTDKNCGNDK